MLMGVEYFRFSYNSFDLSHFLGDLEKFLKGNIALDMSVCPSIRPSS